MIIGFISDAHGSPLGLELCLGALQSVNTDRVYFLGDAVGYFPDTIQVLSLLKNSRIRCLMGNHEAMLVGQLPLEPEGEQICRIEEARSRMSEKWFREVSTWPDKEVLDLDGQRIVMMHGRPSAPLTGYLYPDADLNELSDLEADVLVVGHTHRPFFRTASGLKILNAGSTSLPRQGGGRATCAVYDTETTEARLIDVPLPLDQLVERYRTIVHERVIETLRRQMKDMKPITVMVTGVGGGGLGEQLLKALRLASTPYEIVGADMDPRSIGLQMVDHPYIMPAASDHAYLDTVIALAKHHGVRCLLAGSEPELRVVSANRERLQKAGLLVLVNPSQVIEICLDKVRTMAFLQDHGFGYPRYSQVAAAADLDQVDYFPVVLKPLAGAGGSVNTFIAQSKKELEFFGRYLLDLTGRFICQEYVGTPEDEYTVGVLLDMAGNLINSIAVRRNLAPGLSHKIRIPNRTGRKELGPTLVVSTGISQGEIGRFAEVTEPCERLALALGCTSAVNIQCRLVNGQPCIFEINPRFSGTSSLRAMVGYNEPDLLIRRHILNEELSAGFNYESGVIGRGLQEVLLRETNYPRAMDLLAGES